LVSGTALCPFSPLALSQPPLFFSLPVSAVSLVNIFHFLTFFSSSLDFCPVLVARIVPSKEFFQLPSSDPRSATLFSAITHELQLLFFLPFRPLPTMCYVCSFIFFFSRFGTVSVRTLMSGICFSLFFVPDDLSPLPPLYMFSLPCSSDRSPLFIAASSPFSTIPPPR